MKRLRPVVIEIDEDPISLFREDVFDYVGTMLHGALFEPLGALAAEAGWTASRAGLSHVLEIGSSARWSDGRPVEALDFFDTFRRRAAQPYWARHLRHFRGIRVTRAGALRLDLRRPLGYLRELLSSPYMGPAGSAFPGMRSGRFNGPYAMSSYSRGYSYRLTPNAHYPGAEERPPLTFAVNRDPGRSPVWFDRGRTHISCGTGFPYDQIGARRGTAEFRHEESPILMQLDFDPETDGPLVSVELRRALFLSLDRAAIARELHGGLVPARTVAPACFRRSMAALDLGFDPAQARALVRRAGIPGKPLRVHFNDYYPNRSVLEAIRGRWRDILGIEVAMKAVPFDRPMKAGFDLMLNLRVPAFDHPYAALESFDWGMRRLSAGADRGRFDVLMRRVAAADREEARADSRTASAIVFKSMVALPLFEVPNLYLRRPEVRGFRFPRGGAFEFEDLRWSAC